jgi:hypothetical protein
LISWKILFLLLALVLCCIVFIVCKKY